MALELDLTDPLGADLMVGDDAEPTMRMVSGLALLARDAWHRITTRRGLVLDDEDFGIDITEYLHAAMTPAAIANVETQVAAEIGKDPRVASVTAVLRQDGPNAFTIVIRGTAITDEAFDLVGAVADVRPRLLSINGVAVNDNVGEEAAA